MSTAVGSSRRRGRPRARSTRPCGARRRSRSPRRWPATASARADQTLVWGEIANRQHRARTVAPTDALHDMYAQRDEVLSEAEARLEVPQEAVGLIVVIRGRARCADVFDKLVHCVPTGRGWCARMRSRPRTQVWRAQRIWSRLSDCSVAPAAQPDANSPRAVSGSTYA